VYHYFVLVIILLVLIFFYKRFEEKRLAEENQDNIQTIRKFLLGEDDLVKSTKPILWIHVPYEYNSRRWLTFESRSSFELNQPYLYLTVRSIIEKCQDDFTICILDDTSFAKLLPDWWSIEMKKLASPVTQKIRLLGQLRLLYRYGGLWCPISFLCMQSLLPFYKKGTREGSKVFVCEMVNRNITSTDMFFYPSIKFCGGVKENETWKKLMHFVERTISNDFTSESVFLGEFDRWCSRRVHDGEIVQVNGLEIGVKSTEDRPILVDDLLSQHYLNLVATNLFGIYIPSEEILNRPKYEWFARLSSEQVLASNTMLGKYFLVTFGEHSLLVAKTKKNGTLHRGFLEPVVVRASQDSAVTGFWKTPLYPGLYGNKPNFLGDNLHTVPYPGAY
jgi:hypothetical protein